MLDVVSTSNLISMKLLIGYNVTSSTIIIIDHIMNGIAMLTTKFWEGIYLRIRPNFIYILF